MPRAQLLRVARSGRLFPALTTLTSLVTLSHPYRGRLYNLFADERLLEMPSPCFDRA